jgi:hypothetical protein
MALDPEAWDEACRRRAAGESLRAIGDALGISAKTLGRRFADARKMKPRAKAKPARRLPVKKQKTAMAEASAAPKRVRSSAPAVRRQLIARLYRAIDTKLKLMERRMNSEIDAIDSVAGVPASEDAAAAGARTSADHERETRAFGALVKTINSVRQMQAELDTLANAHTASLAAGPANTVQSAADARLAADAERYRRDIAERLAKFIPPQS